LWCTQKWAKVWYPYILGPCGVHYRNISSCITEGYTWASPSLPPCVSDLVCSIYLSSLWMSLKEQSHYVMSRLFSF
jgi:hypothetical protein